MNRALGALTLFLFWLSGCGYLSEVKNQLLNDYSEQLYIDAQLGFSLKHPLDWQIMPHSGPISAAAASSVHWRIPASAQQGQQSAGLVIHSFPGELYSGPAELLREFLPEESLAAADAFPHPAGPALQLLVNDSETSQVVIALTGQQRNFILLLKCPSSRLNKLLPLFIETARSLTEVAPVTGQGS